MSLLKLLATSTLLLSSNVQFSLASQAGSFADGGNTLISAMMMFLGNEEKVYILDKAEGNAAAVNGHPAWGSVWDINTHQAEVMDVRTNTFCSSGMHLPNGSFITLGGNGAIGPGGNIGSTRNPDGVSGFWDNTYDDFDGAKSIRILNPCTSQDDITSAQCSWYDDPTVLAMQKKRWYSAAEPTGTGEVVILGGFVNGGYVNRNYPNTDPEFEGNASECTYEFYPSRAQQPQPVQFLIDTSGLNAYAHSFQMASGKMFVQSNLSTMLWDYNANTEERLPPMPNGVVRVYPASGAVAMLPLTVADNYTQTIIFCGGSTMPDYGYGNFSFPFYNTWEWPASNDCQRITPEPADGSPAAYEQDDDMLEGRSMGQFIILPDGTLLVINGGLNGTAGFSQATGETTNFADMPFGESLASGPVGTPAIYNPKAPQGSRWTNAGFASSNIARLYHSSAILLPDASVLVAGSNPNFDVNTSTIYPTTYAAEIFYPSYFSASTRPVHLGYRQLLAMAEIPSNTTVVLHRGGFTTHAMNMGQRLMQLNNTFTVNNDGSITLHVAQAPPNPNIFQPGPAYLFVVIAGIPSNGTYVIVGNGVIGDQPTSTASVLPASVRADNVKGSGDSNNNSANSSSGAKNANGAMDLVPSMVQAIVALSAACLFHVL
ncbi:copper radical oxidase [Cyathus striatus]|nr:copper radical oxidase [Cyathus striatus]